jgi:hypothetical protein
MMVADSFVAGLGAHLTGVAFVLSKPALVRLCIPQTGLSVGLAVVLAIGLWFACLLLRLPPLAWTVSLDTVLLLSSLLVMYAAHGFLPTRRGTVFFSALSACSEPEATKLRAMPIVRGLAAQLRSIASKTVVGVGTLALVLLAVLIATAALSPIIIIPAAAASLVFAWALMRLGPALSAFSGIAKISWGATVVLAVFWVCGLVPMVLVEVLSEVCWGYMISIAHGQQLLSQLSVRMGRKEWDVWCESRRLALAGFGLPVWALMRFAHPLLGLVMLEVQYGAAGVFLCGHVHQLPVLEGVKSCKEV